MLRAQTQRFHGEYNSESPGSHPAEEIEDSPARATLAAGIRASSVVWPDGRMCYQSTREVAELCADLALRVTQAHTMPLDVAVAGYSLGDIRRVFRTLYRRAQVHLAYCWYRAGTLDHQEVWSLPLWVDRSGLEAELVNLGPLEGSVFDRTLEDLTYRSTSWTDIRYQPLMPVGAGHYLVSPIVVLDSAWERNVLKLWANKYQHEYSAMVSGHKRRAESDLRDLFQRHGFVAPAGRVLQHVTARRSETLT